MPTESKRTYTKRLRAESETETRQRITEAAMALHGSIGPSRTTIKAVADAAGVQRATVYRHFPTEAALFESCSAHWYSLYPPPDAAAWASVADVDARLERALGELYSWYGSDVEMFVNIVRDAQVVPAMKGPFERRMQAIEMMLGVLMRGRLERGRRRERIRATIAHAVSFPAWHSLVVVGGMRDDEAVAAMLGAVAASGS